ncbi:helix-turn-helix domain-containing protein [Streptomyces sp. NPDC053474]|uniref:helix-turn-helix domain-containing protein n=1 Tax=Streptomyces sp. NPDC053474 TaxID=3365704 RepID=UPI0037D96DD1
MTTRGAGREPHPARPPAPSAVEHAQVVRRLTRAAARSGALLVAEVAALAEGWAALVDPAAGLVHATPDSAGPTALRAAAHPQAHPHVAVHQVPGAQGTVLVVCPGVAASPPLTALVTQCAVDLLRLRARHAEETRGTEQRVHTAVLRLLLRGQHRLAAEVLGGETATHATVYRLTGRALHTAHHALWRATQPDLSNGTRTLVSLDGAELTVVALHGARDLPRADGGHPTLSLVARVADRHQLTGGAAAPAPLDMFVTAWAEAGSTRNSTSIGRLTSVTGLGAHGLLRVIPTDRLVTWSAAVLQPLDGRERRTLEAWLRSGSAQAAAPALDVSEGTVRSRLRSIGVLLAVDLDHPTVQAQSLLALRAPASPVPAAVAQPLLPSPPLPAALLSAERAGRWASGLLQPLDPRLRIALRCWLAHRGRTAPAATELALHRTTLSTWLSECGRLLDLDLSSATVRAELRLAVETAATADDVPAALPRRGGRTYREPGR